MPSKFAFTTVHEGLSQLVGVIALHEVMDSTKKGCLADMREILTQLPMDVKIADGLAMRYQYSSAANFTVKRWIEMIDTNDVHAITRLDLDDAKVMSAADPTSLESWNQLLESIQEFHRANQSFVLSQNDYRRLGRDIGDKAKALKDVKSLRGCYVHFSSSRRTTTGWVISGRGNTAHVLKDRWAPTDLLRMSTPPEVFHRGNPNDLDLNGQKLEEWRLDSTGDVVVMLPTPAATTRKILVLQWERKARESFAKAQATWAAREEWERDGGREAKERRDRIAEVTKVNTPRPKLRDYYSTDEAKRWFRIAIEEAGGEDVLRLKVIADAVKEIGGELTPVEVDILDKEPLAVPVEFSAVWKSEWDKALNPVPETEEEEQE